MPRIRKKLSKKAISELSAYIEKKKAEKVRVEVMDYTETELIEKEVKEVDECLPFKDQPTVTWINITGIHETDIIEKIGKQFELHPLIIEDILTQNQTPKLEEFENFLFIILKTVDYDKTNTEIKFYQVSLIINSKFVISFLEKDLGIFNSIKQRIRTGKGRIRRMGTDYLGYSLIDAIVDNYFGILEAIGEEIEKIEDELINNPTPKTLSAFHRLKRDLIFLRRSVWPLRDIINKLQRTESELIKKSTEIYLRDVYDHVIQIIDTIETFRDMVSGMLEVYLSSISNRMNEVMKVLTIIATIFIPLTFLTGIYGMNFEYLPELKVKWAYPLFWAIIIITATTMFIFFKKKKWV